MAAQDSETILAVDDNPATLYSTSRVLKSAGFNVATAESGSAAIATAVNHRPDLIVLDVHLPDIDGFQVCRKLRANPATARIPVVYLSATFVSDVAKVEGLDAGADGYLTHPVEPPVLIATVNAFLRARRAEDALRTSEAKFKAVFDQALNGICLLSKEMVFLETNPAFSHTLGREQDFFAGKHLTAFVPADHQSEAEEIGNALGAGGAWRGTFPMLHTDGRKIELEWSISIHSVPGVWLAITNDVTERRAIEAERERLLASEQAARAEAERASRVKDDFLATLSHEIRTPLNAILGWSQVLENGEDDPAVVREGMDVITRNARAQAQLVDDMLDMSRITAGKLRLDVKRVSLAEIIKSVVTSLSPAAEARGVRVFTTLGNAPDTVSGDPARLQQVVWNLLSNAVKFTPRGGKVQVVLRRVDSHLELSISDSGRGISPEFLPFVFDRFRQADSTTRRAQGGLGLGLSIVKQLVELHGGTVRAASEGEGRGATFTVELPLPATQNEAAGSTQAAVAGAGYISKGPILAGLTVLVVDDEPDARSMVTRILSSADAHVLVAESVQQACELLAREKPQVIVSDIGMPVEDGYDLIRRVRSMSDNEGGRTPAVALTAYAGAEDRKRVLHAGFQSHLAKPVDASELVMVVASLAGRTGR